jgi:hypothetical protein
VTIAPTTAPTIIGEFFLRKLVKFTSENSAGLVSVDKNVLNAEGLQADHEQNCNSVSYASIIAVILCWVPTIGESGDKPESIEASIALSCCN